MSRTLDRRRFLLGAGAAVAGSLVAGPRAKALRVPFPDGDEIPEALAPVLYISHGGPNLAVSGTRGAELRAWGDNITKPRGIVSITPHYRSRGIELGAVGPGRGARSFPARFARATRNIDYQTPDNTALAGRVRELLATRGEVRQSARTANDHTTWMPLLHLFPDADVPVLEVALPFTPDPKVFALGQALSPLRAEGIVIHCSGQLTHNLAMVGRPGPPVPWARAFDEWVTEQIEERDYQALVDWRRAAPDAYLVHPDDGGHYDVLLVALGAVEATGLSEVTYPVDGFELSALSKRCIDFR